MVTIIDSGATMKELATKYNLAVNLCTPKKVSIATNSVVTDLSTCTIKLEETTPVVPPLPPPDGSLSISALADHDLIIGEAIFITSTGTLRRADNSLSPAVGVASTGGSVAQLVSYVSEGSIVRSDWTSITGVENLIPGRVYYLASHGMLTPTPPTVGLSQQIGTAVSHYMLDVEIRPAIQLA